MHPVPTQCPVCGDELRVTRLRCDSCNTALEGVFSVGRWLRLNREYAAKWPNITARGIPPADAKEWDGIPGKLAHLSREPHQDDEDPQVSTLPVSEEAGKVLP